MRAALFSTVLLPLALGVACQTTDNRSSDVRSLTVLYSNDEHGWMEGREANRGAANLMGLWRDREGYIEEGPFLLLSGGDHWTGPAISTWFEGESMVEVMNTMAYDASAIGNHEFDFGLDNLERRIRQAEYPYLAANVRWREGNAIPDELGILAHTLLEVNELTVAIIGLSTVDTPATTNPVNIAALRFLDYEPVLRRTVAQLESDDPDLLFVVAHVCMAALRPLATAVADLGISLMGGGHCNERVAEKIGETVLLESDGHFRSYARAQFEYDKSQDQLLSVSFSTHGNEAGRSDDDIDAVVAKWRSATADELDGVLAYSAEAYEADDDRLQRMVATSWLRVDDRAEIAINNRLALRAPMPAGEVRLADVVGLLPFENSLFLVELSGAEIVQVLAEGQRPFVAGLTPDSDAWRLSVSGDLLDEAESYSVLINSFMYEGGAGYDAIAEFDPLGFNTEIHYRQPLIDWLLEQQSTAERPISPLD